MHILCRLSAALLLGAVSAMPAQAQDCPWLATSVIDQAFPEQAPWDVMAGGQGRCKFSSDASRPHSNISLTQIVHDSPAAAEQYAKTVAGGMAKAGYVVAPLPALGKEGAAVRQNQADSRMLTLVGHRGAIVVMTQMSFFGGVDAAGQGIAEKLTLDTFDKDTGGGLVLPKAKP